MLRTFKKSLLRLLLIAVLILPCFLSVVPNAQAATGKISGRVTSAEEPGGVGGICVEAYGSGTYYTGYYTDNSGNYTIEGVQPGEYGVCFWDQSEAYLDEWYNNKPGDQSEGYDLVTVNSGATTSGINSVLSKGGIIQGRITDAETGLPIEGIRLEVGIDSGGSWYELETDSQGNYSTDRLPSGQYIVSFARDLFDDYGLDSVYKGEFYNNKDSLDQADRITITSGKTVTANAALQPYPYISGRVTSDKEPGGVENVDVVAYDSRYRMIAADVTDATGGYRLVGLVDSSYHVRFNPERATNIYKEEWFNDKNGFNYSIPIEVKTENGTSGINAHLEEATSRDTRMKAVCMLGDWGTGLFGSYESILEGHANFSDYLESRGLKVERLFAQGPDDPSYSFSSFYGTRDYALASMENAKLIYYQGHGGPGGSISCFGGWDWDVFKDIHLAENPVIFLGGACYSQGPAAGMSFTQEEMKENVASFANAYMGWNRGGVIDYSQKNNGFALYLAGVDWRYATDKLLSNQDYRLDEFVDFQTSPMGEELDLYMEDPYRYNDESDPDNPMKGDYRMILPDPVGGGALVGNFNLTSNDIISTIPPPEIPSGYDTTFYFAEGCTSYGFREYLTLGNPASSAANIQVLYMFANGDWQIEQVTVPAGARTTVDVNNSVGAGKDVSVRIASDQAIVAERPMYFDYNGLTGGSDVMGATSPANDWYFAEGYTGPGFDEWVCVLNPGGKQADLTFRFQTQEAGEIVKTGFSVAPHSRATFKANDLLDGMTYQTSLKLESTQPVVAERPMYFSYSGNGGWDWTGGHCVMGSPSLSKSFFFAEGTTRGGFEQWLTLQNPGTEAITVDAVYQLGAGQGDNVTRKYTIGAGERATVFVESEVGAEKDVSVKLTSSSDFLAERPMYFNYQNVWTGGHCVIGAVSPEAEWFLAEGYTGPGFDEYICLQNPGDTEATVRITYLTQEAGALPAKEIKVPARSRSTVLVNTDAGADYQLSVKLEVTSGPDIVVERPMYFDYNGWTGGHDVVGYTP